MVIKDLASLREVMAERVARPIVGVGVTAFNRLGLERVVPNYSLICLEKGLELELIRKDIKVLCLEEKLGRLKEKRNATTVVRQKIVQEYLHSLGKPALVFYKMSEEMGEICQKNNWPMVVTATRFGKKLFENKVIFRDILEKVGISVIPSELIILKELMKKDYNFLRNKVVQFPDKGGGKGTFFIREEENYQSFMKRCREEWQEEYGDKKVIVSKFIRGSSPSMTVCVTSQGIISTNLQQQILDVTCLVGKKRGNGMFCGHDWSGADFEPKILECAYDYAERLGRYFRTEGYRGIFGLDMLIDEERGQLFVVECNPRLLGSFPVLTMAQLLNGEVPLMGLHLLEFLGISYDMDVAAVNRSVRQKKRGAQFFVSNLNAEAVVIQKELAAGVYILGREGLKYQRPGYDLRDLNSEEEFIITDGVPAKGITRAAFGRLVRVLTLKRILKKAPNQLDPWAEKIATKVRLALLNQ